MKDLAGDWGLDFAQVSLVLYLVALATMFVLGWICCLVIRRTR